MSAIGRKQRIARRPHKCERCRFPIKAGDFYEEVKTTPHNEYWPGSWNTWRTHWVCPTDDYEASL